MDPETASLKSALEKCRDKGMTAIAFLLKDDGGTSYLGPPISDAEIVAILECAAEAFRQRAVPNRSALN